MVKKRKNKAPSNQDIFLFGFILAGALGLYSVVEWIFQNLINPLGNMFDVLQWGSNIGDMSPLKIGITFLIMVVGWNYFENAVNAFCDVIRDIYNKLF